MYPLITVGIVVLNREWIIGKMLDSLLCQTFPHDRIFVVVVDGGSKDRTVEIARKVLEKSNFMGYEVIVKECNIPEGRNICIEKMKGDALFFWDSDVIMQPNALQDMVTVMIREKAEIVNANCIPIFIDSIEEIDKKIDEILGLTCHPQDSIVEVQNVEMGGSTLISRSVFSSVRFDPDLTFFEDLDFSMRAKEKGFKIILARHIVTVDVNMWNKRYSDIHIGMPLRLALRGMRKKARVRALTYSFSMNFKDVIVFFLKQRRYLFYLGYIPTFIITIYGILADNFFIPMLPIYLCLFGFVQIKKRGVKNGIRSVFRSLIVGVPFSLWLLYYLTKYTIRK